MKKSIKRREEWRSYKPNKTNNGAASKLELKIVREDKERNGKSYKDRDVQIFWVSTKQTGMDANDNASFGWKDPKQTITFKLGEVDIGEILAVLNGVKASVGSGGKFEGLFHQNDRGNASFALKRLDSGYSLRLSRKLKEGDTAPFAISHMLSWGEAEILRIVLDMAVRTIYQW